MNNPKTHPPIWIDRFLEFILKESFHDEVIGDMHEWYAFKSESLSKSSLTFNYLKTTVLAIRKHRLKSIHQFLIQLIEIAMISNNIKTGIRSILKNKRFATINVVGLASAFAVFIFIYNYVSFEWSYDRFHTKSDHIYRVLTKDLLAGERHRSTCTPLAPAFLNKFPEMIEFARFGGDPVFVQLEDKSYYEENFYWGDSSIFKVFDLPFLYGSSLMALREPNTMVLTQEVSEKYFGAGVNPVGKLLPIKVYDGNQELTMRIDGVLQKLPANTDLPFELLGSMVNGLELYKRFENMWGFNWLHTYAYIPSATNVQTLEDGIPDIIETSLGEEFVAKKSFSFQPLKEVHLYSTDIKRSDTSGDITYVLIFSVIGLFILIIATANFVNLSTSRLSERSKEISVRKVNGASRKQLFDQLWTELILVSLLAFVLALVAVLLLWEPYQQLTGKLIAMESLLKPQFLLSLGVVFIIPALLASIYPALRLASFDPSKILKGIAIKKQKRGVRQVLVTVQFAISILLIICTSVIFLQVHSMVNADLGFNASQLINIKVEDRDLQENMELLKTELASVPGVVVIGASSEELPSEMNNTWDFYWDENSKNQDITIDVVGVGKDFFETVQIDFIAGNNLRGLFRTDSTVSVVINEAAAALIPGDDLIDQKIGVGGNECRITGIVKNYHYQSLKSPIKPVAYIMTRSGNRTSPDNLLVRVNTSQVFETISGLNMVWDELSPNAFFDFHFVDQQYASLYESETKFIKLFSIFSVLSIIISCIGLLGIVMVVTNNRRKEISIRKVLGSSVSNVVLLITREFGWIFLIGSAIAIPIAVIALNSWLDQFVFHISISLWTIVGALFLLVLMAFLTIGSSILKVAFSNPVDYLRDE